jgi:uroporphyrin-III C-methyltransferase
MTALGPVRAETAPASAADDIRPGAVWLIGGGPAEPDLIPTTALRAIRSADIVLFDATLGGEVATWLRAGARYAEPVPPSEPARERAIGRAIALACDGWRVVRLVDGEPLATPHGREAARALEAAEVSFRIVVETASPTAALASAGVPAWAGAERRTRRATPDLPPSAETASLAGLAG